MNEAAASQTATTRIWHPDDFTGTPFSSRPRLFETMKVGDEVLMWAVTSNEYASIRSSAYSLGNRKSWKFHTKRKGPQIVRVWRES